MKKKLLAVLGLTMVVATVSACASNDTNQPAEATESEVIQERGDLIENTDIAIFDNNVFSFDFDSKYFTVTEDKDVVTVSYNNEDVQTAGSNVITFTKLENADAKEIIKSYMEKYDASEEEMVENYLGGDDVKGYSYATLDLGAEGSDLKTREAFYAVPCGKDVILINKFRTVGPDMELENSIDAQLDEVILSFKLIK